MALEKTADFLALLNRALAVGDGPEFVIVEAESDEGGSCTYIVHSPTRAFCARTSFDPFPFRQVAKGLAAQFLEKNPKQRAVFIVSLRTDLAEDHFT